MHSTRGIAALFIPVFITQAEGVPVTTLTLPRVHTRDEYVRDRLVSHDDYYAQFVTPETLRHVGWAFDTETLRKALAEDEHLNSIPLRRWDLLAIRELEVRNQGRLNPSGRFTAAIPFDRDVAATAGEWISRATLVCIAKRAARMIVERSSAPAPITTERS